jgi:hypothetical protein
LTSFLGKSEEDEEKFIMEEETKSGKNEIEMFSVEPMENTEETDKKKKREAIFEMALFLILGILLGITIKTESIKRITIGFNDYKIVNAKNAYDIEEIKNNLQKQAEAAQAAQAVQQQNQPQ